MSFSKDGKYCVSRVKLNDINSTDYYIESHPVNESGLIINASAGISQDTVYKKYRYTMTELGIDNNETITGIYFGAAGFLGYSNQCLLAIKTRTATTTNNSTTYRHFIHFYTYHLSDEGRIGKAYNEEPNIVQNSKVEYSNMSLFSSVYTGGNIIFSETKPYVFFLMYWRSDIFKYQYIRKNVISTTVNNSSVILNVSFGGAISLGQRTIDDEINVSMSRDDKYIFIEPRTKSNVGAIIQIDSNLNPIQYRGQNFGLSSWQYCQALNIMICITSNYIYIANKSGESWATQKTLAWTPPTGDFFIGTALITPDESRLIVLTSKLSGDPSTWINYTSMHVLIFNIDDILNAENSRNSFSCSNCITSIFQQWYKFLF